MTKPIITTWRQLREHLREQLGGYIPADSILHRIRQTALDGDPEWLLDILTEVQFNNLPKTSPYYLQEFHGALEGTMLDIEQIYETFIHFYVKPNTKP